MKKIAVVYSTKFGHTKQYADWLKEDIDADVMSIDGFNITKMVAYKLVIFACGVYGDKLPIMDFIKKNISSIPVQKIMIMAVSWYTNDSEEAAHKLIEENFPEQFKKAVPLYVVNSGLDKKKVPAMDKAKLIAAQMMIEKKDGRSSDDINALAIIKGYSDQTSRDNLASIKKGVEEFFDPSKKEQNDVPQKPASTPKPASAPKPAAPAPAAAEKPKPAPETAAQPQETSPAQQDEPVVRFNSSGQVVVSSVLDAINSLNTNTQSVPSYKPAAEAAEPEENTEVPAPKAETPAPAPKAEAAADENDLSKLADEAFKHLGAAKPASEPATKAETPAPAPKAEVAADENDLSKLADEAFKHLGAARPAPEPAPKAEAPAPAPKSEAAADENDLNKLADEAFKQLSTPKSEVPTPAPEPEIPVQNVSEPAPETAAPQHKNSYMEMFASRRKKREEDVPAQPAPSAIDLSPSAPDAPAAPAAEPVKEEPPKPAVSQTVSSDNGFMDFELDFSPELSEAEEFTFTKPKASAAAKPAPKAEVPAPKPAPEPAPKPIETPVFAPAGSDVIDFDDFEFIGEETKPTASKRALNAVQDMAKAKAAAEAEAAKKAAEKAAEEAAYKDDQVQQSQAVETAVHEDTSSVIEKMKHDMELLVEESEHSSEAESEVYSESVSAPQDETYISKPEDDGLSAFAFADTADYYSKEPQTHVIEDFEDVIPEHNADLDLRKLQEQINASIETNKANREKMQAKYGKKQKEAVHNPFAVQFDDEDEKKDKKGKKQAPPPKRLDDPIDPDIFFSRPNKSKEFDMLSDTMPEIKFKNR